MVGFKPVDVQPTLAIKFFSAGTAASMADIVTFPLDTAKVRLQIQGEATKAESGGSTAAAKARAPGASNFKYRGMFGTMVTIVRQEGARALYNGLVAGLQRQMSFASVRIGLYDPVKQYYQNATQHALPAGSVITRIMAGVTTGAMAVSFAQPTDVVKVRLQAQSNVSGSAVRYTGALHAYRTIGREEGIRGLWKGCLPNITRNSIVNATELVCYDMVKERILKSQLLSDNLPCHFFSAFCAGFVTTCVASPVDVVKTRYMNSRKGQYKGAFDCAVKMFKEGGPKAFYKGFMPSFTRLGSWNVFMFVFYEQLKRGFTHASIAYENRKGVY
ncbi:dicarboxylate carrier UCP2-like [Ptychodera flava]|uniref:dicarboxylate carrier UCP2-like n=1 Tax=Ptychodera flava TaxID=63121 RepID=UPI00396A99A8